MPQTVNKSLIRNRFNKQLKHYDQHASVQIQTASRLVEALTGVRGKTFPEVLEIGCGTGTLTRVIAESLRIMTFKANDLIEPCEGFIVKAFNASDTQSVSFISGDFEDDLPLPCHLDLIISNATFQWFADLKTMLSRLSESLKPHGLLAFSTFGPDNLQEIRSLTGTGLSYPFADTIATWLASHYRLLYQWEDTISLPFPSPRAVLQHLRRTGVNAITPTHWQPSSLRRFEEAYRERWSTDNSVSLTYHPMIFIAEKA